MLIIYLWLILIGFPEKNRIFKEIFEVGLRNRMLMFEFFIISVKFELVE